MKLVHHHLIYQAKVNHPDLGVESEKELKQLLIDLLDVTGMQCLIEPQVKLSHQKAWTGLLGIITSHISFHYWTIEQYVQLDIYSCKEFNREATVEFLNNFWQASETKTLFIDREVGKPFITIEN